MLARVALAMAGLAIVLAVQLRTGSFAMAGVASGTFGFANVLAAPFRARAIDVWGQRRTLIPLGAVQAVSLTSLALATNARPARPGLLVALCVAIGLVTPPVGAAMRTIWRESTSEGTQRTRALSLDAIADDAVFIVGPVLTANLAAIFSANSALLVAATAVLVGTLGMTTSPASRGLRGEARTPGRTHGPLRRPGFVRVLVVLWGVGMVLGTVEVAVPALSLAHRDEAAAGWLLAGLSVGSAVGGLLYGHVPWKASLRTRLAALGAGMGVLTCAVAFVANLWLFGVGLLTIGMCLSPCIVTGYLAAERLVPVRAFTEASAWTNTSLNFGAAIANAAAGTIVAATGAGSAMLASGILAVGVTAFAVRGLTSALSAVALPSTMDPNPADN